MWVAADGAMWVRVRDGWEAVEQGATWARDWWRQRDPSDVGLGRATWGVGTVMLGVVMLPSREGISSESGVEGVL
jgi:hypothetical protein